MEKINTKEQNTLKGNMGILLYTLMTLLYPPILDYSSKGLYKLYGKKKLVRDEQL